MGFGRPQRMGQFQGKIQGLVDTGFGLGVTQSGGFGPDGNPIKSQVSVVGGPTSPVQPPTPPTSPTSPGGGGGGGGSFGQPAVGGGGNMALRGFGGMAYRRPPSFAGGYQGVPGGIARNYGIGGYGAEGYGGGGGFVSGLGPGGRPVPQQAGAGGNAVNTQSGAGNRAPKIPAPGYGGGGGGAGGAGGIGPQGQGLGGALSQSLAVGQGLMDPDSDYYKRLAEAMRHQMGAQQQAAQRAAALRAAQGGLGMGASPELLQTQGEIGQAGLDAAGTAQANLALQAPQLGAQIAQGTFGPGLGLQQLAEGARQFTSGLENQQYQFGQGMAFNQQQAAAQQALQQAQMQQQANLANQQAQMQMYLAQLNAAMGGF